MQALHQEERQKKIASKSQTIGLCDVRLGDGAGID
jgi:hypothetical protein